MDKVLIITGGGRGIGAAVARQAADSGYTVAVNYQRDAAAAEALVTAIRNKGGRASAFQADIGAADEVERLFKEVERDLGTAVALVNNAGIT